MTPSREKGILYHMSAQSNDHIQFAAYNDPNNFDTWINPTEHTFVVGVHIDHKGGQPSRQHPKGGPRSQYFRFLPKSETLVPKEFRHVIQTYLCSDPECQTSPGSKLCFKDHPAVVMGGKCPQLIRKGADHIRQNPVFDDSFVETKKWDGARWQFELEKKEEVQKRAVDTGVPTTMNNVPPKGSSTGARRGPVSE